MEDGNQDRVGGWMGEGGIGRRGGGGGVRWINGKVNRRRG